MANEHGRQAVIDTTMGLEGTKSVVSLVLALTLGFGLWRPLRGWVLSVTGLDGLVLRSELALAVHDSWWTSLVSLALAGLVAAVLKRLYGSAPATAFLTAVLAFPLFVFAVVLSWCVRMTGGLFAMAAGLGGFSDALIRRPWGLVFLVILGGAASWAALKLEGAPFVVRTLCAVVLPGVAALTVLWMYFWTFNPLAALDGVKGLWDQALGLVAAAKKARIAKALAAGDHAAVEHEYASTRRIVDTLETMADRLTQPHVVTPVTVHLFVGLLVLVTLCVSGLFAVSYVGLYRLAPGEVYVSPGHETGADFLYFSVRTLLFADDRFLYAAGATARLVSFV